MSNAVRLVEGGKANDTNSVIDQQLIANVEVSLEACLGSTVMTVGELMALKTGDTVAIDAALNRDVELKLNGVTVARGELVAVGTKFGVRLLEVAR